MFPMQQHIHSIATLCAAHKVKHLYAFGSVLSDEFKADSDIDLLVLFHPLESTAYADNYYDLKSSLEKLFNRKVDLLEEQALRNPYLLHSIEENKQLLYVN